MSLRLSVLIVGGFLVGMALLFLTQPTQWQAALYLAFYGAAIITLILIERGRYKPSLKGKGGAWRPTGERFVDPATGKLTEVYFNEVTGERDYVVIAGGSSETPH
jgi:sugar phosphate permease